MAHILIDLCNVLTVSIFIRNEETFEVSPSQTNKV